MEKFSRLKESKFQEIITQELRIEKILCIRKKFVYREGMEEETREAGTNHEYV